MMSTPAKHPRRQGHCSRQEHRLAVVVAVLALAVLAEPVTAHADSSGDVQQMQPSKPKDSQAELDERFLSDLTNAGITITNVRQVVGDARNICAYIGAKHTEADAVQLAMRDNRTLTEANAQTLIESAEGVYCPQLSPSGSLA